MCKNQYLNGKLHREDGPAVIYANGTKEWWLMVDTFHYLYFLSFVKEQINNDL